MGGSMMRSALIAMAFLPAGNAFYSGVHLRGNVLPTTHSPEYVFLRTAHVRPSVGKVLCSTGEATLGDAGERLRSLADRGNRAAVLTEARELVSSGALPLTSENIDGEWAVAASSAAKLDGVMVVVDSGKGLVQLSSGMTKSTFRLENAACGDVVLVPYATRVAAVIKSPEPEQVFAYTCGPGASAAPLRPCPDRPLVLALGD
jgi:hypothetical protein